MNRYLFIFLFLVLLVSACVQSNNNVAESFPDEDLESALAGCQLFPVDHIWNAKVDKLPIDKNSGLYINTIGATTSFHPDFGSGFWEGAPIGIPFNIVSGTQAKVNVSFEYASESDKGPYPIPSNPNIEGGPNSTGDRHILILDKDNCKLYELFSAYKQADGSWKAASGAIYDLKSYALRPDGWTSADAAGLAILPGLVRYAEVKSGVIKHAIRFTVPQTRNAYVWPARHYASDLSNIKYPPMGQRFRLKANVDISRFSPDVKVILQAMKTYGIILADNGSSWFISGVPNNSWNNDILREIKQLNGSNFEAVDSSSLMLNVNSGQVRSSSSFAERPYLFKAAEARLRAAIAANEPEATGTAVNNTGQPIGFITLAKAAHATRESYSDVPSWHLALAGWLLGDTSMKQRARNETMAIVLAQPGGDNDRSDNFQHVEDRLLEVAAVADLAYTEFTQAQLAQVATWVNGTLTNWNKNNLEYWPFDDPLNNYWQNGFLAHVIGGVATQGFNPSAASWRTKAQEMATKFTAATTGAWQGPVQSEGHYYSSYVSHALWAMELSDAALGTTMVSAAKFSVAKQLDLAMYQTRPHLSKFFEVGSEANNQLATHTGVSLRYWFHLIHAGGPNLAQAQQAKAILQIAMNDNENFWSRADKAFANFYWSIRSVPEVPLSAKTDRLYAAPTPGAGLIGLRSSAGFQPSALAALMFANNFTFAPGFSHSNPDAPGFQWGSGTSWLVTDPEYFNSSGILAEAGSGVYSDVSNIVTLAGQQYNGKGGYPIIKFAEHQPTASVPHSYIQIDAQPYWNSASVYRREYIWLDDLQVVVLVDRIVGTPAKTWRLHIPTRPTISEQNVTYTVDGKTVKIRNLLGNTAWQAQSVYGIWRLTQTNASNDYNSVKVLDVGGRVSGASATANTGGYQVKLTINGLARVIQVYTNGNHALIQ